MRSGRDWGLVLLLLVSGGVACTGSGTVDSPTGSVPAAGSSAFEVREVLDSSSGGGAPLDSFPFTTGVIKADDPYRHDPAFEEAAPDGSGDLVTYADSNGDGFYTPEFDTKFLLGPAEITDDVLWARAVARTIPGGSGKPSWDVDYRLDTAGTRALAHLSRRLLGSRLAVVVDRVVVAAPIVQGPITSGRGQIGGNFTEQQARDIAAAITSGRGSGPSLAQPNEQSMITLPKARSRIASS